MKKNRNLFSLKNKKIILTGSSGLLGEEFKNYFLENGAIVIGIDLKRNFKNKKKNFYFYKCDFSKPNSIKEICKQIEKIINKN